MMEYEYTYTVDGWFTAGALFEGETERASNETKELTMKCSVGGGRHKANFYLLRLTENEKEIATFKATNYEQAKTFFMRICAKHKLNHERYNPQ